MAAKPSEQELARAPHHLLGHVVAPEKYTAGRYRRDALKILEQRFEQSVPQVFVTGGTGFYFLALEKGMFDVPEVPENFREQIQKEVEEGRSSDLYSELLEKDPDYALKIGENDSYRIQRALELIRFLGKTMGQIQNEFQQEPLPWTVVKLGLRVERETLRSLVKERTQRMLDGGLIEEVEGLLAEGLSDWAPLQSVGYKETGEYLRGRIDRDQLFFEIVKNTMNLAKRQMTWFKRDKDVKWFDPLEQMDQALDHIEESIDQYRGK